MKVFVKFHCVTDTYFLLYVQKLVYIGAPTGTRESELYLEQGNRSTFV